MPTELITEGESYWQFAGYELVYTNGAHRPVEADDEICVYTDATLIAQWRSRMSGPGWELTKTTDNMKNIRFYRISSLTSLRMSIQALAPTATRQADPVKPEPGGDGPGSRSRPESLTAIP